MTKRAPKPTDDQREQRLADAIAEDLGADREPTEEQRATFVGALADLLAAAPPEAES